MALKIKLTQQMQLIILGVIVACGAFFAVINFIVAPMITDWKAALARTREIQVKLEEQRGVVKTRSNVQQQMDESQATVTRFSAHIPSPVLGNYLLGMEKIIRAAAGELDVQISQIANQDIQELEATGCRAYRVRVTAQAGCQSLIRLFQNLQDSNPLLSISGITIVPREDNREKHDVTFTVSWLVWADPAKRPAFLLKAPAKEMPESSKEIPEAGQHGG